MTEQSTKFGDLQIKWFESDHEIFNDEDSVCVCVCSQFVFENIFVPLFDIKILIIGVDRDQSQRMNNNEKNAWTTS